MRKILQYGSANQTYIKGSILPAAKIGYVLTVNLIMNKDTADAIINYPVVCGKVEERMNITNQYRCVVIIELFYYR